MAPTIETFRSKSQPEVKRIEEYRKFTEDIVARERTVDERRELKEFKKDLSDFVTRVFREVELVPKWGTSLHETSLTNFDTTFKQIRELYPKKKGFSLEALRVSKTKNPREFLHLGFVCELKEFEERYPALCEAYVDHSYANQAFDCWKVLSDIEEWIPEDGEIQILRKGVPSDEGPISYDEQIILSVPFSMVSPIGMAAKKITDKYTYLD